MLNFALNHYAVYLLVLLRMVAFIGTSPILSMQVWPVWAKLGLGAFSALWVASSVTTGAVPSPFSDPGNYILTALQEAAVGMLLGFIATMIFSAVTIAGQIFDVQIGFASATLFDPSQGQPESLTASLQSLLFTLYFLGVNGLDGLMLAIMDSYHFVPIGHFHLHQGFWQVLTAVLGTTMNLAIQFAAPLVAALLLTDITFAFLSRAVPQMNVFVVELPAKLFVGLTMYAILMPATTYLFGQLFGVVFTQMNGLLQWLGG